MLKVCCNISVLAMKNLSGLSRQKSRFYIKYLERNNVANLSVNVLRGTGCIIIHQEQVQHSFGGFLFASVFFLGNVCLSNLRD